MKLLASINYSEIMNEQTLQPLVNSKKVRQIYVVHELDVPEMVKVKQYSPPKWLHTVSYEVTLRGVLMAIAHLLLMVYITGMKKPDAVIGFHIFHGQYAFICGKIFRKPVIAYVDDWPGNWHLRRRLIPALKRCNIVTTTGTKTKAYLIEQGIDEDKLFILPDSINTERFKPVLQPKRYDVIFMGRLDPDKNIDTFLRIIARAKQSKTNLKVGIIGDGQLMVSLKELSRQLGITDNIEFLGYRNNPEYYYNSAKIFVLASLREGLSMAMLEAMACGIPCVVSNVGDTTDAAINGVNAIVIDDPYDIGSFANAITKLSSDEELYHKLSQNARQIVKEKYSFESATEAWNKIFKSIGIGVYHANTSSKDILP